jgi:serine/threonine-protein kinase
LAVIIAIVVIVIHSNSNTSAASHTTTSPPPTDFSSTKPDPSPQSSSATTFTADQAALADDLPSSYSLADCSGVAVPAQLGAKAALSCGKGSSTPGPTTAAFFLYPNLTSLRADFQKLMTAQSVAQTDQQCPAIGFRSYHFDDAPTVTVGNMASYIERDTTAGNGSAVIAWTIEPDLVLSIAVNSGGSSTLDDMCSWWTAN